jgi:uncharacterized repeat protein (TIGR03803 family)
LSKAAGGNDGSFPDAGLIEGSDGNFYGTTQFGGGTGCVASLGCGTVFKITPTGAETVLHSFKEGTNAAYPQAGLIADSAGNLYGTTWGGGASGIGTVFKVAPGGAESVLYSFKGGSDGWLPGASLVADGKGDLYSTTYGGVGTGCVGTGCGTVFELTDTGFAALQACKSTDAVLASIKFPKSGQLTYHLSSPTRTTSLVSLSRQTNIGSWTLPAIQSGGHSATGGIVNTANASQPASFVLQVSFTNPAFACFIDAARATLQITTVGTVVQSLIGVPKSEHLAAIANGTPGLNRLKITVNGTPFETLSLQPGGTAFADLSAAMTLEENTLTFTGQVSPGGSLLGSYANVLVSNSLASN